LGECVHPTHRNVRDGWGTRAFVAEDITRAFVAEDIARAFLAEDILTGSWWLG